MTSSQRDLFAVGFPAERRALFGLATAAVSDCVSPELGTALAESDPLILARDAQRLQVHTLMGSVLVRHPALATRLPTDLVLFFRAMHAANRQRIAQGLAQLEEIGAALDAAGIPAIVLKGGGDMLSPIHADPAIRYVGDLDILVPANRAADAMAMMHGLGAAPAVLPAHETSRFDWRGQRLSRHHLPRLVRPDWTFPVEIHIQTGPGAIAAVLNPAAVLDRRLPTAVPGLSIACAEDRACHLLTHATRHDGMVSLRAWVDWSALRERCDRKAVATRLYRAGHGHTLKSFDLIADVLKGGDAFSTSRKEASVARGALRAFGAAGIRSIADLPRFLFRRVRGLFLSSAYRRHIAGELVERGFLGAITFRFGRSRPDRQVSRRLQRRPKE